MSQWAHGTTLGYADAGTSPSGTFTVIGTVEEIDAKKLKRAAIKITVLNSPNNQEQKRAGMIDAEAFKFKVQYAATLHNTLLGYFYADSPNKAWQIVLTDGQKFTGDGFLTEMDEVPKAVNEDVYETEMSIMPIGMWTATAP